MDWDGGNGRRRVSDEMYYDNVNANHAVASTSRFDSNQHDLGARSHANGFGAKYAARVVRRTLQPPDASPEVEYEVAWFYEDDEDETHGPFSLSDFRFWLQALQKSKREGEWEGEYEKFAAMLCWKEQGGGEQSEKKSVMKWVGLAWEEQQAILSFLRKLRSQEPPKASSSKSQVHQKPQRDANSEETVEELTRKTAAVVKAALKGTKEWQRKQVSQEEFNDISRKSLDGVLNGMKKNPDLTYAPTIDAFVETQTESICSFSVKMLKHFMKNVV